MKRVIAVVEAVVPDDWSTHETKVEIRKRLEHSAGDVQYGADEIKVVSVKLERGK